MSRDSIENILLLDEINKPEPSRIFRLLTLETEDPEVPCLYFVDSNYDVTYGGVEYTRFPFQFSEITVNTDGSVDKASLTIANVSRELMYFIENGDGLRNRRVTVKSVFAKFLDFTYSPQADGTIITSENPDADPDIYVEDEFLIDAYSADEKVIQFQLDPVIDFGIRLPRRLFTTGSCYWFAFKDSETCGYVAGQVIAKATTVAGDPYVKLTADDAVAVGDFIQIEGVAGVKKVTKVDQGILALYLLNLHNSPDDPATDTYADASGNGNDLTPVSSPHLITNRFGEGNSALAFDGVDDRASSVKLPAPFTGAFAISFWATTSITTRRHALSLGTSTGDNLEFSFNNGAGLKVYWAGTGATNYINAGASGAYADGVWRRFILQRVGTQLQLYIDGVLVGTTTYAGAIGSPVLTIGASTDDLFFWYGGVDEVAVYNRALSAQEIAYTGGLASGAFWITVDTPPNISGSDLAIDFITCSKSYRDCVRRNNIARFGGFPGIRSSRYVRF